MENNNAKITVKILKLIIIIILIREIQDFTGSYDVTSDIKFILNFFSKLFNLTFQKETFKYLTLV